VREAGRKSSFFKYTISLEHQKKNHGEIKVRTVRTVKHMQLAGGPPIEPRRGERRMQACRIYTKAPIGRQMAAKNIL